VLDRTREKTLGANLKDARQARSLTLDKLAQLSGLTRGYLSLVERGLKTPSIAALVRIAAALDMNMAQLFDQNAAPAPQYSLYRAGSERTPKHENGRLWLAPLAAARSGKIMEPFILQPPFKPATRATHAGEEMLYVLSGEVGINLGGEEILLQAGDCLYFSSETHHEVRSVGGKTAEALVVIASGTN
jgi:transcriptional regulator with XRE-family HTH domain